MPSDTTESGADRHPHEVRGVAAWREQRADVRRRRLVEALLGPPPVSPPGTPLGRPQGSPQCSPLGAPLGSPLGAPPSTGPGPGPGSGAGAGPGSRRLGARARSLWCGFLSGLG